VSSRPLGRSLDPLPGESLNGFLLRLSCRLHVSPARLAQPGIVTSATRGLSRRRLLDTDPGILAQLARLSVSEAAALTLVPWADRYPPIARSLLRGTGPRPPADDWLFTPETRYCPRCLAGDGSTVQDELGGCWQLAWHLPVVFACPRHRLPLQAGCTQDHPAHTHGRTLLIRLPGDSSLHPAQCRQPLPGTGSRGHRRQPCGQRLDQPDPEPARLDPEALAFQGRMLDMFDSSYPADDAAAYFSDLGAPGSPTKGDNSLLVLGGQDLAAASLRSGELLAAMEGGGTTIAVSCDATCSVRQVANGLPATHGEGHLLVVAGGPTVSPRRTGRRHGRANVASSSSGSQAG